MRERLVRVRVELAAGQADDVRRIQPRVLGVDRDEELDDLTGVERVEEHRRHLDRHVFPGLRQRVQGEQAMLAVEHSQHTVLFRNLEQAEVVLAGDRGEGESLLRGDDDGPRDRGQGRRVFALSVVRHELVDLPADDRPLVRGLALADPLLETVPVDAGPVHPRLLGRLVGRTTGVAQDLELH